MGCTQMELSLHKKEELIRIMEYNDSVDSCSGLMGLQSTDEFDWFTTKVFAGYVSCDISYINTVYTIAIYTPYPTTKS